MRFFSSQQNGELLPVSFKRSELVNEAETNLGTARLAVKSVRLFLGVASETVDVRALAEGIGVTDSRVPALELVGAVIDVLGITIADSSKEVAAEGRTFVPSSAPQPFRASAFFRSRESLIRSKESRTFTWLSK